jgi:phosphoheptose isomerase
MYPEIEKLLESYADLRPIAVDIQRGCELLISCYRAGGKVLVCGNGGSAADCEHLVGELMKGYLSARPLPAAQRAALAAAGDGAYLADHLQGALPAISLVSQVGLMTAVANDIGPDMIFAQQVYGYGRAGDVLIAISTSGNSRNILLAAQAARAFGLGTLGVTGRRGALRDVVEVTIGVPHDLTAVIQERHLAIYHAICGALERTLFGQA